MDNKSKVRIREYINWVDFYECCNKRWIDSWVWVFTPEQLELVDWTLLEDALAFYKKKIITKNTWEQLIEHIIRETLYSITWKPTIECRLSILLYQDKDEDIKRKLYNMQWWLNPFQYHLRRITWFNTMLNGIIDTVKALPDNSNMQKRYVNGWAQKHTNRKWDVMISLRFLGGFSD